jgi:protein subunit release factor A
VRLIHKPTGQWVRSTAERSQNANKEKAMAILRAKLETLQEEEEARKHSKSEKIKSAPAIVQKKSEPIIFYKIELLIIA